MSNLIKVLDERQDQKETSFLKLQFNNETWTTMTPAFVNALRRIILSEIETMAIDKVVMYQNTSVM